ncbi:hypothetical protein K6119_04935 [Paracrocinitomix mangrovi]|uniref:hypothetical protein n=1 Tax=Paracrocinitomix mangrovi TaxID=2862509 RepID=UPI001C8DBEAB|nr:hypothetical protein [Paracrocinitomix mangrovi]UKN02858.1 hypothetical protein K6119_04935 [Paracrocinitomix mangrovi]
MGRIHAFEFEDLNWFPKNLRDYGTDFLQFATNTFDFYKGVVPLIKKGIEASGTHQVLDLGSGGGGGWKKLSQHLKEEMPDIKITLSDYYPNKTALEKMVKYDPEVFSYLDQQVDAKNVPSEIKSFRTQFLSFHHFKEEDARQILQNAVDAKVPIGIFEGQKRDVPHFIKNLFSPISLILTTPFIHPFKLGRIIFTYIIPLVPLFVMWDGVISVLRTYSVKEMKQLVDSLENSESFNWEIGIHKERGISVPYLLGLPK